MVALIFILIICILFPDISISCAKETILLWFHSVLPVLLPFFILSKGIYFLGGAEFFAKLLRPVTTFFGLPKDAAFPLSMSLLCGFPTGSRMVDSVCGDNNEAKEYLGNICFSSSPIFILGTVGEVMLKSAREGYALFALHLCTLIIFTLFYQPKQNFILDASAYEKGSLSQAVTQSITSVLSICGFMIFFNLISRIFTLILPVAEPWMWLISGFCEFTSGIGLLSQQGDWSLPFISFFLSFGGSCVIAQCISFLKGVNVLRFIFNRFLCGIIAFLLCFLYKKTALYVPITLTALLSVIGFVLRRKNLCFSYLLKSSKS